MEENKDGVVVLKFLLFSQYKSGKPQLPAVMLYFRPKFWDLKVSSVSFIHMAGDWGYQRF